MNRPLAEKKLKVHVDGSFRGFSPEGRMMDKVIDTRAGGRVLEERNGSGSVVIPTYDEIKRAFEDSGIPVEGLQTPSLEVISVGGVPGDDSAEVHSNVGSIVTLGTFEVPYSTLKTAMSMLGDGFGFSRVEAEIEGKTVSGPRPFASKELELIMGVPDVSPQKQAELEQMIDEETPAGYSSVNPDISNTNQGLSINIRDKKLFKEQFNTIMTIVSDEVSHSFEYLLIRVA